MPKEQKKAIKIKIRMSKKLLEACKKRKYVKSIRIKKTIECCNAIFKLEVLGFDAK